MATIIPISASAVYSFSTDDTAGAVLLTAPPVVHERYYYESPFKDWVKANAVEILRLRPEVKEYGLWIVTSTYGTKMAAINMWKQAGQSVKVGFSAKAVGVGECGPSGEWYKDDRQEGWNEFGSPEVCVSDHNYDQFAERRDD